MNRLLSWLNHTADSSNSSTTGSKWMLPVLLLIQALFIGSTFQTYALTLGAFVCAVLTVTLVQYLLGDSINRPAETLPPKAGEEGRNLNPNRDASSQFSITRFVLGTQRLLSVPLAAIGSLIGAGSRVIHHVSGNLNPIAMVVDAIAHAAFIASVILWVFFPRRGHPAMLGCGLAIVLTTITAGGVSHSVNGQLVAALGTVIAFTMAAQHILGRWEADRAQQTRLRRKRKSKYRQRKLLGETLDSTSPQLALPDSSVFVESQQGRSALLYSALALSVLLMSTSAAGHIAARVVPGLQLDLFDRLSQSLEAVTANSIVGGSRYVRGSSLGSVRQHMLGEPGQVALAAVAERAPGHLRGTVFDSYQQGVWSASETNEYAEHSDAQSLETRIAVLEQAGETELYGRSQRNLERFQLRKQPTGRFVGTIEVHNVPFKGDIVFASLSTNWIEAAIQGEAIITHQDAIDGGIDTRSPYVLGISSETPREQLSPLRKLLMLSLSDRVRKSVAPIARSVCEGRVTARTKARAIEEYFQSNFTYSLNSTENTSEDDPIVNFLDTQHPAHCEYFATAAAIMLRTQGVPTRYVTGYVVNEQSENGEYWIARNKDAHAWVEAYDEKEGQWFPVEATVGRAYQTLAYENNLIADSGGAFAGFLDDDDDRSLLGKMVGWLLSLRATDSLTWVFRIAQLPLFCLVATLLWIRHRRKLRSSEDPMEYESRQMLARVDRRMKKMALVRAKSETLHQFASRIESAATEDLQVAMYLQRVASWYRDFASKRYRGQMPSALELSSAKSI